MATDIRDYIPKYIKQTENKRPKNTVTADRWNELWNLSVLQGDYTSEVLGDTISELLAVQAIVDTYAPQFGKLEGIQAGAEVNVQSDWSIVDNTLDSFIKNKPTIPTQLNQLTEDATHRFVTDTEKATWNRSKISSGAMTYYVNAATGSDSNNGLTPGTAFATIQYAIGKVPQVLNHEYDIYVAPGTYNENIAITGFMGKAGLFIRGDESGISTACTVNFFSVYNCSCNIYISGFNCVSTTTSNVIAYLVNYMELAFMNLVTAGTQHGVSANQNSSVYIHDSTISNRGRAIYATGGAKIYVTACNGVNNTNVYYILSGGEIYYNATTTITGATLTNSNPGLIVDSTGRPVASAPLSHTHVMAHITDLAAALAAKQTALVSGTNIKTIGGVSLLGAGNIILPTSNSTTDDIDYYVKTTGSDSNDGLTIGTAFKTIQHAIDSIPQIVNHIITIYVSAGTYSETSIYIKGFIGAGAIQITGAETVATTHNVTGFDVDNCTCTVYIDGFNCLGGDTACITAKNVTNLEIWNMNMITAGAGSGVYASDGASVEVSDSVISNRNSALRAAAGAKIFADYVNGTGNNSAYYAMSGGEIYYLNDCGVIGTTQIYQSGGIVIAQDGVPTAAEPKITTKNTAFNKNYETTATNIKMNGVQAVGTADTIARGDHVHPVDTSRQPALVSGTSIKTINSNSLLGSGNIDVAPVNHSHPQADVLNLINALQAKQDVLVSATNIKTINGSSILGSGDLVITGEGGAAAWGGITGTLADQADLVTALGGKANATHNQAASTITDFDTEVSNNTDVAANTTARHAAVTVADSTSIDLTLTGQDISAVAKFGTTLGTVCQGNDARLSDARTPTAHTHGNITNDGKIGITATLPIITGTSGVLQAGAFGTTAGTFCQGNDSRLADARTPVAHNQALSTISDVTATAAEVNILDGVTATTAELNYTDGVTSNIQTQLDAKAAKAPTIAAVTASKTLVIGDAGTVLKCTHATVAINITVPTNASVAFPIGTEIAVIQGGVAQVAVVAAGGVTINPATTLKINAQYQSAVLVKEATDTWGLYGSLKA